MPSFSKTRQFFEKIKNNLLIIHYSCENLSDNNDGLSPRITSIVIHHTNGNSTHSFSIHLQAEIKQIAKEEIENHYNDLEKDMLENFYKFVRDHTDYYWLHWNMRNINFGFEAIAHRYKVLTQNEPPIIDDNKRINLSSQIFKKYGYNCVDHPKMANIMKLNDELPRDFLTGEKEVEAFKNKEYFKLHKSTLSKVTMFNILLNKLLYGKIKTKRSNFPQKINDFMELPLIKILGFLGILASIGGGIYLISSKWIKIIAVIKNIF